MDKKEKKSLPEPRTYTVEQIAAMLNICLLYTSIGQNALGHAGKRFILQRHGERGEYRRTHHACHKASGRHQRRQHHAVQQDVYKRQSADCTIFSAKMP